jgi:hypothetical protein
VKNTRQFRLKFKVAVELKTGGSAIIKGVAPEEADE